MEVAPSYWNDKRSMPLLPWLPATRKKRFPVAKRSPKVNTNELMLASPESNKKVSADLEGIFGESINEKNGVEGSMKKQRSSEDSHAIVANNLKKNDKAAVMHEHNHMHVHEAPRKKKRDISDPDDDEEADNENGMRICILHAPSIILLMALSFSIQYYVRYSR